jgi:hypothetical protein
MNVIIELKWNAQGQGMYFLGLPNFSGLKLLGGRPGYRYYILPPLLDRRCIISCKNINA